MNGETVAFGVIAAVLVASGLASSLVRRTFHSVMFLGVFLVSVAALYILLGSPLVGIIQILVYVGGILTLFVFAVMFVAGDEADEADAAPVQRSRSTAWPPLLAAGVAVLAIYLAVRYAGRANTLVADALGGSTMALLAGFAAATLLVVVLAIAGLVAWLGLRHTVDHWSGTRIFGTLLAALLLGLLLHLVAQATPWGEPAEQAGIAANEVGSVVAALFGAQVVAFEVLGVLLTAVMIGALVIARPMAAPLDEERYSIVTPEQVQESQDASDVALHTQEPGAAGAPATEASP